MPLTREKIAEESRFGRNRKAVQEATDLLAGAFNVINGNQSVEVGAMTDFEEGLAILQDSLNDVSLPLRDKNGTPFGIGVWFRYQVGTAHECKGILEHDDGVTWIRWDSGTERCRLRDFWHEPTDPQLTEAV